VFRQTASVCPIPENGRAYSKLKMAGRKL